MAPKAAANMCTWALVARDYPRQHERRYKQEEAWAGLGLYQAS